MMHSTNKQPKTVSERTAERAFNFRPFLFAAVFFVLGIVFCFLVVVYGLSPWWLLLCVPFVVFKIVLSNRKGGSALLFLLLALCFVVGYARFYGEVSSFRSAKEYEGEYGVFAVVIERYDYGEVQKLVLDDLIFDGESVSGKMVVFAPKQSTIALSDVVSFSAIIYTDLRLEMDGRFRAEDVYERVYYHANDISAISVCGQEFDLFRFLRNHVWSRLSAGLDEDVASVVYAVLTGETSGMDFALLSNVRYGGVAHLFAVSGLHVGALYGFCSILLERGKRFRLPKAARFFTLAFLLCFYGGVCGFSSSVVRAIVTCLCFYAKKLRGSAKDGLQTIGLAALVTACLQPTLIFSIGLQLSFAACLGICLLHRPLYRHFTIAELAVARGVRTLTKRRDEWDDKPLLDRIEVPARQAPPEIPERIRAAITSFLATCTAAQIATAPIQLSAFGYLSGLGLLLNCLFVPLISAIFSLLLILTVIACVLPISVVPVLLFPVEVLFSGALLCFYAVEFSSFVWTLFFPITAIAPYYAAWIFYTDKLNLSKKARAIFAAVFAAIAIVVILCCNL